MSNFRYIKLNCESFLMEIVPENELLISEAFHNASEQFIKREFTEIKLLLWRDLTFDLLLQSAYCDTEKL